MADVNATLGISVYVEDKRAGVADALAKMNTETSKFGRTFGSSFRDVSTLLRRGVSEVRFFGAALAGAFGVQLSATAIANEVQHLIEQYRAGQVALKQLAAQERIAGTDTADLTKQVEALAESGKRLFGTTTEQVAQLASQARALGLNSQQMQVAVEVAETLSKVAGKDLGGTLDLVGRGLLGNVDAMKQFGAELRLRVTSASEFVTALQRVRAEFLETQAKVLEASYKNVPFASQFAYQQAEASALPRVLAMRAEAERIRKETSSRLLSEGGEVSASRDRQAKAQDEARRLTNAMAELKRSASLTDSIPDQLRQVEIRTSVELDKLTEDYLSAARQLNKEGLTPSNSGIGANLVNQLFATQSELRQKQARDMAEIERGVAQRSVTLMEESRVRMSEGRARELAEIDAYRNQDLRSLEEAHRKGLVSEEAYQNARLGIVVEARRRETRITGTGADGAMEALREGAEQLSDEFGRGKRAVEDLGDAFERNLGQSAYDAVTKAKSAAGAIKGFDKGFFDDIARAASASLAGLAKAGLFAGLKAIFGGGAASDPFAANPGNVGADGGWFDSAGWHGAQISGARFARMSRGADVRRFEHGGIATRPTLGLFGEAGPEAFVPLKGGRIPVSIRGGGGGGNVLNLYLSAIDTQSGLSFLAEHREHLWGLWRDGFDRRSEFRGMARRT